MAFLREVERLAEAAREIGLERLDPLGVEPFVVLRAARELPQLAGVPAVSHHQAPALDGARESRWPPAEALQAERCHQRLGALALAPRRQHAARKPGAAARA